MKDYWEETGSEVEFVASNLKPVRLSATAVKIFIFDKENKLLLVKNKKGWDIPGGHIEDGESPVGALKREVIEETGSSLLSSNLVGYLKITNIKTKKINSNYPKESCILLYVGKVTEHRKTLLHEVSEAKFIAYKNVKNYIYAWNEFTESVLAYMRDANKTN